MVLMRPKLKANFEYMYALQSTNLIEIDRSITYQPKLNVILIGDKYPRGPRVHQHRHMQNGGNDQKASFMKSERKLENELKNESIIYRKKNRNSIE